MNIYVHIPFCHSKCAYCAFLSHCDIGKEDEYIEAVCKEICGRFSMYSSREPCESRSSRHCSNNIIRTIYFGGGTPSLIKPENIANIIQTLSKKSKFSEDIEITLESNPEDITIENIKKWRESGINRLSIGIQTLNDSSRKVIGRGLIALEVIERVKLATEYFENVGVDLIAGLPEDNLANLLSTIKQLHGLGVLHISLYDLETDNSSAIGRHPGKFALPNEKESTDMLTGAWGPLKELGYEQYEISNFTKNHHYCQHNLDFWEGRDYLGFGLGATSLVGNKICTNGSDFAKYLSGKDDRNTEVFSPKERAALQLLSATRLNHSFRNALETATGSNSLPRELVDFGFVTDTYTLTSKGKLVYNQVVSRLLEKDEDHVL